MPLYFAYGSNMCLDQMARRCPASRPVGLARLMRHRFVVMPEGWASVARAPRGEVWGLVWELAHADVPALDRYESVGTGLYSKVVQNILASPGKGGAGGPRRALVYVGRPGEGGVPQPGYMEGILAAANSLGLPQAYCASLESFLPKASRKAPHLRYNENTVRGGTDGGFPARRS